MLETEPQIISSYVQSGRVKIVYRHLLQLGEGSLLAAEASECAGAQGKFWQMHNLLYQYQYGGPGYEALAQQLGLDMPKFNQCIASREFKATVEADNAKAVKDSIVGRPYFLINGTPLVGSQAFTRFQAVINAK